MSRFTKELRVIPKAAWIVAWFWLLCFTVPLFFFVAPTDLGKFVAPTEIVKWPRWGQALFIYGIFLLTVALVALIGYVYGDAKRRQMPYVMWTLLATFVPYAIGTILYFILRDPLPKPCPGCGHVSKRQDSHSVRTAVLCCSQPARNAVSPLTRLGRIARIADSDCPSPRRALPKIVLWRPDAMRFRAICAGGVDQLFSAPTFLLR